MDLNLSYLAAWFEHWLTNWITCLSVCLSVRPPLSQLLVKTGENNLCKVLCTGPVQIHSSVLQTVTVTSQLSHTEVKSRSHTSLTFSQGERSQQQHNCNEGETRWGHPDPECVCVRVCPLCRSSAAVSQTVSTSCCLLLDASRPFYRRWGRARAVRNAWRNKGIFTLSLLDKLAKSH